MFKVRLYILNFIAYVIFDDFMKSLLSLKTWELLQ